MVYIHQKVSLPCHCIYHDICIIEWQKVHSCSCPICGEQELAESYSVAMSRYTASYVEPVNLENDDRAMLSIRRRHFWKDVLSKIGRCTTGGIKQVKIDFVGEEGSDFGGLTRDFFTDCFEGAKGLLVHGLENNYSFLHDTVRLQRKEYLILGQLTALALFHKCAGPRYFNSATISAIFDNNGFVTPGIADVADSEIQNVLQSIQEDNNPESCILKLEAFEERYEAGYNKYPITFNDKTDLLNSVCHHHVVSKVHEEITQFRDGLKLNGLLDIFLQFPSDGVAELGYSESSLTADKLKEKLQVCGTFK